MLNAKEVLQEKASKSNNIYITDGFFTNEMIKKVSKHMFKATVFVFTDENGKTDKIEYSNIKDIIETKTGLNIKI